MGVDDYREWARYAEPAEIARVVRAFARQWLGVKG